MGFEWVLLHHPLNADSECCGFCEREHHFDRKRFCNDVDKIKVSSDIVRNNDFRTFGKYLSIGVEKTSLD